MSIIGPAQTIEGLEQSAYEVREQKERRGLPAVISDARAMKLEAYEQNRKLARAISDVLNQFKPPDEHESRFILGWRLYPNEKHPHWLHYWRDGGDENHACGCGCGGWAPDGSTDY